VAVLLPHALFWFSTLSLRIENPYTQWVWIANPDQRHDMEHQQGRIGNGMVSNIRWVGNPTQWTAEHQARRNEHPQGWAQWVWSTHHNKAKNSRKWTSVITKIRTCLEKKQQQTHNKTPR